MITTFTLAERTTPVRRLGAAMTALAASTGAGYALGAALAGRFADLVGHLPAFAVTAFHGARGRAGLGGCRCRAQSGGDSCAGTQDGAGVHGAIGIPRATIRGARSGVRRR
ncbi:hypothetical protein BJF86_01700 [Serinicoccus sp. CNJ-927]|uniref:hypothetical protein n=1 Tax=Serinicoccus sp. CNJ-927 TaxID=1904970 RepID=UPI00095E4381|nr:hypothetical protein [Serinicoccus sp. CNJ-927]OLT43513.1 hypothetical protein BJF86_01700 [Serinicoccus sp. CNJ-927]